MAATFTPIKSSARLTEILKSSPHPKHPDTVSILTAERGTNHQVLDNAFPQYLLDISCQRGFQSGELRIYELPFERSILHWRGPGRGLLLTLPVGNTESFGAGSGTMTNSQAVAAASREAYRVILVYMRSCVKWKSGLRARTQVIHHFGKERPEGRGIVSVYGILCFVREAAKRLTMDALVGEMEWEMENMEFDGEYLDGLEGVYGLIGGDGGIEGEDWEVRGERVE